MALARRKSQAVADDDDADKRAAVEMQREGSGKRHLSRRD